ncbi:hypothetical protein GJAV_G00193140 [Gymnothorax javanicus]|nr:hypothetical protein GJAV_G00193140 [Gymnothorax javanicus]
MGTRIVLHSAAGLLISVILTSHLINVTQGSKVWGEVALPEDLEAEKASVRYPGVTDDEDFAADEASGDLPSGEEDGSTPEPSTVDKTVYFRALVNFTNSFVYTPELENIESEAFREISDAVVDTLESEYNRIAGVQTVNVVVIRKIGDDVFVELDVTSDYNSDNYQIRNVLYSVVEDGSIASYVTSVSGFEFRRLGEVVPSVRPCLESEFTCRDGGCIPQEYFCDKRPDCVDMSDELHCETLSPPEVVPTPPKPLPDRERPQLPVGGPCRVDQATCQNGECIPRDYLCDGERDCTDGSDEIKCGTPSPCEPNEFKCQNGRCALKLWRCDGDNDCGDNSDESYCPTKGPQDTCAPEQFMCVRDRTCIPASYQCDEEPDCADRSDEYDCSPPSVTRPPEESVKAQRGQTVTFTCTAVGVPTPIITWRLNWGHIPTSSRITVTSENGRGTLTIRDVKEGDQGAYTCEAINAKGMVFAVPDGVLTLVQSTGNCPSGHFSVEGGSRCIPCFCFGITKNCQNTGRYRNQIRLRFTEEDDFKGVNVSYPSRPGTPPLSSTQLLINPEMEEFQLVDLSRRFLVLESYWTLPRQFLGNKIDSYGGSLQYKVRYVLARGLSDPEEKPDVILVGNGQRLIYRRTKPTPPTVTNQKEVKFTEEHWQHSSGLPVTREDLMMTLVNLESINIRTIYDNHMVSVALSDIVMDTSTVEYSIQGPAQSVEECRCPAGYSGLSCETCSAGFDRVSGGSFLGTCAGCNCNGHASDCDPVSGQCLRCQHNTEGAQCDKCRPGYFGDPRRGRPDDCKPCPCPYPETSRRFSDTCYLDQDNQATCDACRPGYTGRRCERCAPGYQGNPLQPNGKCVPSASSKCDSRGTVSPTGSRPCTCKSSVVGALCDECRTGSFHLTEGNPEGCLQCFCMGVTKQCASSSWSRDQVRGGVNGQLFTLSNGANTRTITQGIIQKSGSEVAFRSFAEVPSDIYYWVLPENFRGDKVTAYGGELRYTVRYEPRFRSLVIDGQPDVILQGNGIFLEHFSKTKPLPRIPATITVSFREGAWRRADGQPCTREHLIMALADTSVFMIRASYADNMAESSLSDIRMDIAVPHSTGQERALEVEECACPQGYRGPSCQECDVGYSRTGSGLYLGTCERCSCYGHASRCDPETGDCVQCQHNTVGPRCDRCASGYYGDPKTGGAAACQRCPCPGTSPGNQFSQTCYLASDGQPTCDSCPPGYTGRRCESTLDDCEDVFLQGILDGSLPFLCKDAELDLRDETEAVSQSRQEERSEEHLQVKNVADSADAEALDTQSLSSPSVASDGLLHRWEAEPSGQSNSRVDVASPLTHIANTPRPEDGQQNLPSWLRSSWNSFSQRLSMLERAHLDLKEGLQSLSSQQDALHAQLKKLIPSGRLDRARQLEKGYSVLDARMNWLESQLQVLMDSFDRCAAGYIGNPLQGQACTFGNNDLNGNCQHCDRSGTERCDAGRICRCKAHVEGAACSSCRPGHFHLSPEHPEGCLKCFCMGVTQQCSSSNYYRDMVSIAFSPGNFQDMALVNRQRTNRITTGFTVEVSTDGTQLSFSNFGNLEQEAHFWQLPEVFRGDKVGSYGGTLRYTISYVAGQRGTPIEDADVQLIGNDITLVSHQSWQRGQGARESRQFEVAFKEEHWRRPDGMPATREHLMMVLADLDDILIRASYYTDMLSASISDIRMEVSVPNYSGLAQALEVELCRCPPGYQGLSCQDCAPGYSRTGGGLYLGRCELCECNGHSDTCHPETGVCTTCLHNTMGELCEQCAPGYFGDPTAGTPEDCQKCACPHMDPDYQFSPTCESTGNGGYQCTACQPGYTGQYCERCAAGYEGDPQRRVRCRPSNNAASLVVRVHPERVLVAQGNPVMLRCQVTSSPPHYFHWSREDRRPISGQAERRRQGEELYFPSIEPSDAGVYICTCRDQRSSNTSRAEIVVTTVARPIEVTVEEPKAQSVTVGSTVSFICTAKSQSPAYTLVWTRQGNRKLPHRAMDFNGILTIQNVQPDDAGVYVCTGSNMFAMDEGTAVLYVPEASQTQMFYTAYEMFEGHRTPSEGSQAIATVHPPVLTIQQGQRAEFRCTATGNPPPTVEWIVGHGNQISPHAIIRGGVLTITKVERSDEGEYICRASNTHGEHNARAVLYVHSASLPHVQVSPQRVQVNEGETLRLYCRAGGTPSPGLTWKKKGGQLPPQARMERTDIGTLLIPNVRATDAGTYLCVGTNSLGSSEAPIEVSVASAEPFSTAVSIQPPVATVQEGQTLDLSCIIPGAPPVSVSWIRVGGHLPANHQVLGTQLRILNASPEDSGEYICRVDGGPTVRQASVTVTVTPRSPLEPLSHTVSIRPTVAIVRVGQPLELNCFIPGKTSASVTWIRVGGHLPRNHQVSGTRLRILNPSLVDSGEYVCRVDGEPRARQASVTVSVVPRTSVEPSTHPVSIQLSTSTVREGQPLEFTCVVPGTTPRSVTWIRVGGDLPRNHQVSGTRLRILNASPEDSGEYVCRVDDGPTVRQASITVNIAPRSPLEPFSHSVSIRPSTATIREGQPLELDCVVPGSTSRSVTWIRVGGHLPRNHQVLGTRLRILNPSPEDSGEYVCRVDDGRTVQQGSVTVSVTPRSSVEPFLHGVGIRPSTATVQEGQPLELNCVIPGSTPTSVTWIRVGGDLPRNHQVLGTRLRILNPSPEDSGEYVCRVDDGPRVQQGSITVSVTPSFSVEPLLHGVGIRPSTATVQEGRPLELNCVIPGSTPTSVTWIRLGGDLPRNHQVLGTRLRILNPSPEDSGEYVCRVDDGPRVQQGSVTVSVTPSSSVEPFLHGVGIRPSTATVQEGRPLELNCVIPGSTPTSVTWIRLGGDLPRNHQVLGTRLRILNPSPEDSGEYVCRVDNGRTVQQGSVTVSVTPSSSVKPLLHGVDIRPSTATVQEGRPLELNCVIPGSTPTSVTWIRVGGDLPRDHQVLGTWLRIFNPSPEDSGEYVCRVDDGRTVQQGSVTVTVTPRSSVEPLLHGVGIRPSTATVQEGQPLELNCVIPGSTPTSVTWIRVGGDLPRNHQVLGTRLRILNPSPEDAGEYVCRVDDGPRVQQGSVTVSVTPSSSVEPLSHGVGIRPSTATVQEGQPLELTCVVPGGTPTSVTWIRVGGDLPRNHQVSGTRLRIPNTSPEDSGEYICRVEGGPTVQQASVTVTVAPRTSLEPLSHPVSIRPSVASVHEGQPLELDCVVPGSTPRSVTWIRVGGHLPPNHQVLGTRLRILNPSPEDSGEYVCRVDDGRTARQGSVSVSVTPSTSVVPTSNGVSIQPSNATVQEGQPLELDCVIPGRPPIFVTWIRVGGDLPSNHQVLGTQLRILNASPADTGEYVCRVDDGSMVRQASVAVAVTPSSSTASSARLPTPTISIEPHRADVRQGDSASFRCRVHTGVPPVRLEWKLPNNRPMPDNVRVSPDGAVIIISNAQPSDQGAYRCVASNAFGMTHSIVSLSVRVPESPKAVVTPQGLVRVRVGEPINLECQGSGEPRPSVSWHRLDSGRRTVLTSPVPMDSNAVMQVLAARPEDSGTYICTVRNSEGLTEVAVEVRVEGEELAPSAPRASVPEPLLVVEEGQTTTLRCHAYGHPTPTITWSKLRAPLPWRHRVVNNTLILPGVARQDSGQYICNATNSLGTSEVTVMLDVETRPYATCLPDDLAVRVGEVIRLQCLSHGTPPLRFQWTKVNGSLSNRAEVDDGNLQINLATAADAGTYKCVVSNKVGSSEALAKVAVRSPLSVRVWPQVEVKAIGSAVEFTCSATGGVQTTIEWIKEGGPMPVNHHINEGVLRIENLEQSDEGVYICRATGVYGQAQDTAKLTIQALPKVMINIRTSVQTVMIGNSVEFECHATGDPQPSVSWSKVGGELPAHVVVQGGMLKIERVEEADAGQYRCTATNNVGSVQSEVVLNVQSLPQIVSPPDEKEVNLGSGAVFPCVATGYPVPEIKWSKLDGELSSAAVVEGNVLTIPSVKQEDAGTYVCTASNKQGMVQAFTRLKVHERVMPHFTQTPLSYLTLPTIKNSYKAFNIKINFRPDSADGMIIYNGQKRKTGADFVSLGLVGGRPEFRFDVGSGMATLRYPTPITLGEFHTVELHRNLTLGSIVVDGHPPVNGSSQGKFQGLDLNEELFVGGYPNYTVITKKTGLKTGFIGCIRQLIIQGEEVVFKDLDQSSIGVSNCPSCKDRPCQHGGVCEDSETSIYKCSCPWGYTGSNCEHHSSLHCHPEACGADATCINRPSGLGYDCRCHLGKSGDKCTQGTLVTIPHFDGEDSFIAYPPLTNIHNDLRVEVEFKPLDPDGLMFFSGGKKMKVEDFVALSMVDGHVEFRYELGTGMAVLRSREPITIGQWHHVVAERLNKDGFLKVDQDREVRRSSPGKAQGLNIHTPMYLGGVPSMDILPKPANVSMLFEGCVGEVSINGKKVDLSYSFTESRAISQCVDTNPCDRRPCLHGGSCLASAEYEYQCLCLDGFEGERCEVVKHVCQVDAQCKNGGKCADGQCVCPGGFSGLYCEHAYAAQARSILDTLWNTEGSGGNDAPAQHAAYFHDDGYLALPKSIFPRSSPDAPETIELEIRSTTSDGLILWQGVEPSDGLHRLHAGTQELGEEGRGKDYISLGLQRGRLVFSYQLGSGEAEIFSEEPINDGKWHKITAVRTGRLGYVQVDGGAISRGQSQGSSIMVNTKGNVFLGGAPDITALTGSRFSSGITGCVKNLELVNARPGEQPARHIDLQAHAQEGINVERCSS